MGRNRDASGLPSGWAGREIGRFLHPGIAHAEHELARPNVTGEVMNEAACRSSYRNLAMDEFASGRGEWLLGRRLMIEQGFVCMSTAEANEQSRFMSFGVHDACRDSSIPSLRNRSSRIRHKIHKFADKGSMLHSYSNRW
ncbi:hypothetical protein CFAM422_009456 [Trichoderma lentiforme]|uniref:Uncharacterized protein n=1 Tax=Trichoderma lentiforme TaxID=1567552 RepID=A0A9P5CAK4_9HYPO|nr:hypothetical protein CFAM422_009456 [Trichoderma lentiforme]